MRSKLQPDRGIARSGLGLSVTAVAEAASAHVHGDRIAREVPPARAGFDRAGGERMEAKIAEVRDALARGHLAHAVRLVEASLAAGAADTAR